MSYNERFAFLIGFETSLKAIDNAVQMHEWVKKNPEMVEVKTIEVFNNMIGKRREED